MGRPPGPLRFCSIEGCEARVKGHGLCNKHHLRLRRNGTTDSLTLSEIDRFWSKVEKGEYCWKWHGASGDGRYGRFHLSRVGGPKIMVTAHRYSYELTNGPIPEGLVLDHLCRNTFCVNPDHLEPVTIRENTLRGESIPAMNVLVTHCPYGHEYDAINTYINKTGGRHCRTCQARRSVEKRMKAHAARKVTQ